ncbi:protein of unknown function [endosymbiont DhMRE of Dentiscutata heterogama]|uniref:hypothetical protein n=1 Tax=endosymbiont DhMRE of Dentiscutata heterogama TaxID=1609546 RepID=UPI000629D2D5|nr:hypothetical protein [endosymbiont DhMRE of Dentiscutata heterogama]CFW93466.1 protein of unknown function [endosymbiont DhMRE of Dentiscutata heterogama]
MVNIIASTLLDVWILLAVINKGSRVASDVPYYFNKLRQDYLNIQEKMDEERLGSLIKESNVHLEKVKGDIETIKDNNIENDDEFEVINKELTEKERYKEELEKLIHEWEMRLSRMKYGNK